MRLREGLFVCGFLIVVQVLLHFLLKEPTPVPIELPTHTSFSPFPLIQAYDSVGKTTPLDRFLFPSDPIEVPFLRP